jgi:3-oxoadipate enol-lactonase
MATVAVRGGYLGKDGSRLFYEERGQGPVVVLIHDGLLHSETWEGQWEAFSAGHRVIGYDRRSYGRSDLATEPYSDLEDLNALMQHLGVTRATIVGSSAGGDLAMQFAATYPEIVERLVLVGPVAMGLNFSEHFIKRGQSRMAPFIANGDVDQTIANWVDDPYLIAPCNQAAKARLAELLSKNPNNINHPYNLARMPERSTSECLSEIHAPTLIIVGEADVPDVHAHCGAIQAAIAGCGRVIVQQAGHLAYLERPDEFNQIALKFL